jgi:hypothetical protein
MASLDDLRRQVLESQVDNDQRFEWQSLGGENKPLYQGIAPPGSSVSSPVWKIQKFHFVPGPASGNVVSFVQNRTGAWDNRASLF